MLAIWPAKSGLRTEEIYDCRLASPDRGQLRTILGGCAVQCGAKTCIKGFQIGKTIAQSNICQAIIGQCQVTQSVLEAHTAQIFMKINTNHLFEQG